jgi:hypothetical protein
MSIFGRIEKFLYRLFIPHGRSGLKLVVLGAESGAPHKMTHQGYIVVCHPLFS